MNEPMLLLPSDVARVGGVTTLTVRDWVNKGYISPRFRTVTGWRLFDPAEIRAFLARRKKRRKSTR